MADRFVGDHVLRSSGHSSSIGMVDEGRVSVGYQPISTFNTRGGYRPLHLHPHSQTRVMEDEDLEAGAPAKTQIPRRSSSYWHVVVLCECDTMDLVVVR